MGAHKILSVHLTHSVNIYPNGTIRVIFTVSEASDILALPRCFDCNFYMSTVLYVLFVISEVDLIHTLKAVVFKVLNFFT